MQSFASKTSEISPSVTVKIFVGCRLTSEIQMYLKQSLPWKQACILPEEPANLCLKIVYHEKREYIGCYRNAMKTSELREVGEQIKQLLTEYCPKYDTKNCEILVFPQVFVA